MADDPKKEIDELNKGLSSASAELGKLSEASTQTAAVVASNLQSITAAAAATEQEFKKVTSELNSLGNSAYVASETFESFGSTVSDAKVTVQAFNSTVEESRASQEATGKALEAVSGQLQELSESAYISSESFTKGMEETKETVDAVTDSLDELSDTTEAVEKVLGHAYQSSEIYYRRVNELHMAAGDKAARQIENLQLVARQYGVASEEFTRLREQYVESSASEIERYYAQHVARRTAAQADKSEASQRAARQAHAEYLKHAAAKLYADELVARSEEGKIKQMASIIDIFKKADTANEELAVATDKLRAAKEGSIAAIVTLRRRYEEWKDGHPELARSMAVLGGAFRAFGRAVGATVRAAAGLIGMFTRMAVTVITFPFRAWKAIVQTSNEINQQFDKLRQNLEDLRRQFGSLEEGAGAAVMEIASSIQNAGSYFESLGIATQGSLRSMFGWFEDATVAITKLASEMVANFGPMMHRFLDDVVESAVELVALQNAYQITGEQMNAMAVQAQYSGRTIREELVSVSTIAENFASGFGLDARSVVQDVMAMRQNFNAFAHASDTDLVRTSITIRRLGIEVSDLLGLINKFDDFEGAATSAASLAQALGLNIDAMDLLLAADPTDRLELIRTAFLNSGRAFETMSRQEKAYLASQVGLSERATALAFSSQGLAMSFEDIERAMAGADDETDPMLASVEAQTRAMQGLSDAVSGVISRIAQFTGIFDAIARGFMETFARLPGVADFFVDLDNALLMFFDLGAQLAHLVGSSGAFQIFMDGMRGIFDPGVLENFFWRIESAFGKFLTIFTGSADEAKTALWGLLNDIFSAVQEWFSDSGASDVRAQFMSFMMSAFENVFHVIEQVAQGDKFKSAVSTIFEQIGSYFESEEGQEVLNRIIKPLGGGIIKGLKLYFLANLATNLAMIFGKTALTKMLGGLLFAGKAVLVAVAKFGAALLGVVASWPLVIGVAIAAVVASAAYAIYKYWDEIVAFFDSMWEGIKNIASAAWGGVKAISSAAWEGVKAAFDGVLGLLASAWSAVKGAFQAVVGGIGAIFGAVWGEVMSFITPVLEFFSKVWEELVPVFSMIGETIKGFFVGIWEGIKEGVSSAWEWVGSKLTAAVEWIKGLFLSAKETVTGVFSWVGDKITSFFDGVRQKYESFKEGWTSFWEGVADIVPRFIRRIKERFGIASPSREFESIGHMIVEGLRRGVENMPGLLGHVAHLSLRASEAAFGIESPSTAFAGIGSNIVAGMEQSLEAAPSMFSRIFGFSLDGITSLMSNFFSGPVSPIVAILIEPLHNTLSAISDQLGGLFAEQFDELLVQNVQAISQEYLELDRLLEAGLPTVSLTGTLKRFNEAISVARETISLNNKPININVELHVTLDAEELAWSLSDPSNRVSLMLQS